MRPPFLLILFQGSSILVPEASMHIKMSVSIVIFTFLIAAVFVFIVMSRYIIGPFSKLKKGEQVIVVLSFLGVLVVLAFAIVQLVLKILV